MNEADTGGMTKVSSLAAPWVFMVAAVVLAFVCMAAEERREWFRAQVSLSIILVLFFLAAWVWFKSRQVRRSDSPEVATYRQTLNRLLLFAAAGVGAILFNSIRYEHWVEGLVARAAGFGVLVAGAAFITGVADRFSLWVPQPFRQPRQAQ